MDAIENINKLMDAKPTPKYNRPFYIAHEHVVKIDTLSSGLIPGEHKDTVDEFDYCSQLAKHYKDIKEGDIIVGSIVSGMCFSIIPNPISTMTVYEAVCTSAMYPNAVILTTFDSNALATQPDYCLDRQNKLRDTLSYLKIPFMEICYDDKDYDDKCAEYATSMLRDHNSKNASN